MSLLLNQEKDSAGVRAESKSAKVNIKDVTRNRHRGNKESEAANHRIQGSKYHLRDIISNNLVLYGPSTCKEIAARMGLGYTTVSARLSELKALNLIEKTGERRDGAAVVKIK